MTSALARLRALSLPARREASWLAACTLAGLAAGALLGHALAGGLCAAIGYALWLLARLDALFRWQSAGAHVGNAPPSHGLTDAVIGHVHRGRKHGRKQKNRYKRALEQFNALASELPDATVVLDENHQIRWANAAANGLLGIHSERDRGQRIDNLLREPDFQAFLQDAANGSDHEMAMPKAEDRTLALRRVPTGNKLSVIIARDVTQRVRVREMRKAFVGDVSHELRTPLTVIGGYLEVLGEDDSLPPKVRRAIEQITDQSDRMRALVEHLLELSQLEGNPLADDEGEPVALAPMIERVIAAHDAAPTLPDQPAARPHRFETHLDPTLLLRGAESELYSICQNLITNAVRYTAAGTLVQVRWQRNASGDAIFEVADEGPGIEARHLPRLSERFYRVDRGRSRKTGGTGLGLAIVKHVAQRHGGRLTIHSTPGRGSTFRIDFPAHRALVEVSTTPV